MLCSSSGLGRPVLWADGLLRAQLLRQCCLYDDDRRRCRRRCQQHHHHHPAIHSHIILFVP